MMNSWTDVVFSKTKALLQTGLCSFCPHGSTVLVSNIRLLQMLFPKLLLMRSVVRM